nr:hypothetical protein [Bdellovibrionales bacterium]
SYRDSFVKNVERAAMLFPYGKFPSQLMRSAAREKLFGRLDDVTMFEEQVAKIEDSGRDLGDIYYMAESKRRDNGEMSVPDRYRPNERFWRVMHVDARPAGSPRAGTPQYLRDDQGAKTDYRDYIQAYITKDTNCDVLPNPLDPDFQGNALGLLAANPQKSCLERYGAWKKLQDAKRSTIRNAVYKVEE